MPRFSRKSIDKLNTCDDRLQDLMHDVIELCDITILCGHRGEEDQNEAYDTGASNAKWGQSKHNTVPSLAIDIAPYPVDWNDREGFAFLATLVFDVAAQRGIKIKWGGHFKNISDMPHFEIDEG